MKRDMDLVRNLLLFFESRQEHTLMYFDLSGIDGYEPDTIAHHVTIMTEAGLLTPFTLTTDDSPIGPQTVSTHPNLIGYSLSWQGHEFLDAARQDNRWESAKRLAKTVGGVGFEVLKDILVDLTRRGLGIT